MNRLMSNLKLLHKLLLPAVMILIAATVTMVSAETLARLSDANISTVVDQDAARLELALTVVAGSMRQRSAARHPVRRHAR